MKINLNKAFKASVEASLSAGELLIRYQKKISKLQIDAKESQGVVSEADKKAEKMILKILGNHFPEIPFLAEESSFDSEQGMKALQEMAQKSDYCWVIDPLDGTTNFLNGMDYFGICIALLKKGKPVMGLVYRPQRGCAWGAIEGKGTYFYPDLNQKKRKKVAPKFKEKKLKDCLFVTGFTSEKGVFHKKEVQRFQTMLQNSRGIRRMGSAALDMCYTSEGVFDGFWEVELAPWDMSASAIICTEAGLKITDYDGQKFSPFNDSIAVASPKLIKKLRNKLNP